MTARDLLAELRSAGNEEMWNTLVAKFPSEDQAAVSVAADAALANATEGEDGNSPPWHPNDECFSVVIFDVISSSQAPETTVNDFLTCNSHPRRHRAGRIRKGHDNLLVENRRRAGCITAKVLAALLAVEP